METPPFVPEYNKPDAPGIWMNFDNTVSVYHVVGEDDDFNAAAGDIFVLLKEAQDRFPDWPRVLYLEIEGHLDDQGRFEPDFVELQQEFLIAALGQFFTALDMPLVSVLNPNVQSNELPDALRIGPPTGGYNPAS
ncbi:MAG TPA: hypothetical protein VFG50_16525 [Rhodothermales bacterium]|nr:hypothetical protein [Rhodothermales bacterium]